MAENNSYPMLSASNWWNIRKKFKQTIPGTVTASYVSSILNMQERSAANNVMPYLRQIGIIDAEGKTGERAKLWRDDIDYPKVCEEIRKEIYPQELLDIPCVTDEDRESVKRWFARTTGTGESTVGKISTFYFLLCDKDPSKEPTAKQGIPTKVKPSSRTSSRPAHVETVVSSTENIKNQETDKSSTHSVCKPNIPAININLQIHISPEASPEQIEKIFESMSKYIYKDR